MSFYYLYACQIVLPACTVLSVKVCVEFAPNLQSSKTLFLSAICVVLRYLMLVWLEVSLGEEILHFPSYLVISLS